VDAPRKLGLKFNAPLLWVVNLLHAEILGSQEAITTIGSLD
jgi:hypothetical protein